MVGRMSIVSAFTSLTRRVIRIPCGSLTINGTRMMSAALRPEKLRCDVPGTKDTP